MTPTKIKELPAIAERPADYEPVEAQLLYVWQEYLYLPLMGLLVGNDDPSVRVLQNGGVALLRNDDSRTRQGVGPLLGAIRSGRVTFYLGKFAGRFSASISKELRRLGASWDRKKKVWRLEKSFLPAPLRAAIETSEAAFAQTLLRIDALVKKNLPDEIASHVEVSGIFDREIWKVDQKVADTLKGIAVPPQLSPEQRKRLADEWNNDLKRWVKDFTDEQVQSLRKKIELHVFSGGRADAIIAEIRKSYGVTQNKAKFLAYQETGLLMAKFKEVRYAQANVQEYRWKCVVGSKAHPVRPAHKALDGTVQRWDAPPITTEPGQPVRRNNPGQDFRCRCRAHPIVRY